MTDAGNSTETFAAKKYSGEQVEHFAPEKPAEPERRFKGIWANDMKPFVTRRDLIKGLIPLKALTVVWGPPSCG